MFQVLVSHLIPVRGNGAHWRADGRIMSEKLKVPPVDDSRYLIMLSGGRQSVKRNQYHHIAIDLSQWQNQSGIAALAMVVVVD